MPPEDEPALGKPDRSFLVQWIGHTLDNIDIERIPRDPSFVPPRRLNRYECKYTVQDLFGISIEPTDAFPRDHVYGDSFDNNVGALTLGSLWFEGALVAADDTVRAVWQHTDALERLLFVRPTPVKPKPIAVYVATDDEANAYDVMDTNFTLLLRFQKMGAVTIFSKESVGLYHFEKSLLYSGREDLRTEKVDLVDGKTHSLGLVVSNDRATLFLDGRRLATKVIATKEEEDRIVGERVLEFGRPWGPLR